MSRGLGRIERAIRALFDAHPDEAFPVNDLCLAAYPGLSERKIERKHCVAVWRAAHNVLKDDPNWADRPQVLDRRRLVICNRASVPSTIMLGELHKWATREQSLERSREILAAGPPEPRDRTVRSWDGAERYAAAQLRLNKAAAERAVRDHVTLRDADPAERERLKADRQAQSQARLAELAEIIRQHESCVKVLPTANGYPSATLTALANKARALTVENDPDAIRAGLAEIADALASLSGGGTTATG